MYPRFQDALVEYGVDKEEIFQTNDLTERKDIANVTNTLYALGRAVSIIKCLFLIKMIKDSYIHNHLSGAKASRMEGSSIDPKW